MNAEQKALENIRPTVEAAVGAAWADFERAHPALAAELDRGFMVVETLGALRKDPAFGKAIAEGELLAAGSEVVSGLIRMAVRRVMKL